jgi:hypothetical protein
MKHVNEMLVRFSFVMCSISVCGYATAASGRYFGENDSVSIRTTGCNAVSYTPLPREDDLFIGRAFFTSDGTPGKAEDECASPEVKEAISAHRTGLVLDRLDWRDKAFNIVKPLLITPAKITGGPIQGAIIRSAHDPYAALYHGQYLIAFECLVLQAKGAHGTSSCLAVFDITKKEIRSDEIHVVISGQKTDGGLVFHSASVPALLVANDRLYLYWSEITEITSQLSQVQNKFVRIGVRGAELEADDNGLFWVKGAAGKIANSTGPESVEVWGPDVRNTLSDTAVDLKSIWQSRTGIVALVALGGSGCARQGPQPGCFRMAMAKADKPLGDHIFNRSPLLDEAMLPTNGQGYTRPVKNPNGGYSFIGVFYKATINGFSEFRPVPRDWSQIRGGAYIIFPFPDESLWPTQ